MTFGYLSTVQSPEHGFFGGYLILSPLGRPLEFHCTAPVRPSRAQQILYGPTLQPYLLGEQIAGALLTQAKLKPQVILTDQPATLCIRPRIDMPLVLLQRPADDAAHAGPEVDGMLVDGHRFELPAGYGADRAAAIDSLTTLAQCVDLAEPFERIHEAIREAQRIGASGLDAGQAA